MTCEHFILYVSARRRWWRGVQKCLNKMYCLVINILCLKLIYTKISKLNFRHSKANHSLLKQKGENKSNLFSKEFTSLLMHLRYQAQV